MKLYNKNEFNYVLVISKILTEQDFILDSGFIPFEHLI